MPLLGETLSVTCALFWAVAVILFRVAGLTISAWSLNLFKNAVATLLFVPTLLILYGFSWPALTPTDFLMLIVSGVIGITIADTFYLKALNLLGPSRHAVVTCLYSPFVISLSFIFLGERFVILQGIGFFLILFGVFLVNYRKAKREIRLKELEWGLFYGVLAELLMAAGIILTKKVVDSHDATYVAAIRLFGGTVGMIIWTALTGTWLKTLSEFRKKDVPWTVLIIGSVFGTYLSMIIWIGGFKYTEASVAAILNQTSVIFILLLARFTLKEQLTRKKIIGSCLGIAGVIIMIAAGNSN